MLGLNRRIVGKNSIFELFQMHAKTKHKKRETTGFNFINHVLTRIKLSCKSLLYFNFILKALTTFDIKALFNFIRNCVNFEATAPQFLECRFSSCDDYFLKKLSSSAINNKANGEKDMYDIYCRERLSSAFVRHKRYISLTAPSFYLLLPHLL